MTRFDGRWLRRVLAVGLVATLPVVAVSTPVGAAGTGCPDGGTWTIRWTGAAGDGYWEKQANWEPADGVARTPQSADRVCIDTGVGGGVTAGTAEMGSVSTVVAEVAVTSGPDDPPVVLTGDDVVFTAGTITGPGPLTIDQTDVFADLRNMQDLTMIAATVVGDLEMAAGGVVPSLLSVEAHGAVVGSVRLDDVELLGAALTLGLSDDDTASFEGQIVAHDVDGTGGLVVVEGGHATFAESASLTGISQIFLLDASIDHRGPFKVVAYGTGVRDLVVEGVGPSSVLVVERYPDVIDDPIGPITVEINTGRIDGTLAVTGQPGRDGPVDRLRGSVFVRSSGSLLLDGIDFAFGSVISQGTIRLDRTTVRSLEAFSGMLTNFGRLEIGARQGAEVDPLRASAVFAESAELLNFGEVVAVDPSAELTLGGYTNYDGEEAPPDRGTLSVPVSTVIPVAQMPLFSGAGEPLKVPWLAWGAGGLGVIVDGVTESAAGRVVVEGLMRDVGNRRLVVLPGDGYHPCAGERWPVATFDRAALGYRLPTAGTSSVPGAQRSAITTSIFGGSAGWSVVASDRPGSVVATVTGTSSQGCSTPAGGRFVSALYVEGTGRLPTEPEYGLRAGRSATAAGRTAQARVVLKGAEARDHVIDEQYRRILDRPAHANAYAIWGPRLAGRWTPDQLRATLYGSTEFWNLNGRTLSSVTNAVYQRELGRNATAAERSAIARKVNSGTKREAAFAAVMRTAEVDITTGGAMIERWWARAATPLEAFYVGALLYRGDPEAIVAADLAAALPLN